MRSRDTDEQQAAPMVDRHHSAVLNQHGLTKDDLYGKEVRGMWGKPREPKPVNKFADDSAIYSVYLNSKKGDFSEYMNASYEQGRITELQRENMKQWYSDKLRYATKSPSLHDCLKMRVGEKLLTFEQMKTEMVWFQNIQPKSSTLPLPVLPRIDYLEPAQFRVTKGDLLPAHTKKNKRAKHAGAEDDDDNDDEDLDEHEDEDQFEGKRKHSASSARCGKKAADVSFTSDGFLSSSEDESDPIPKKNKKRTSAKAKPRTPEDLALAQDTTPRRSAPKKLKMDHRSHMEGRIQQLGQGRAVVIASCPTGKLVIRIRGENSQKKLPRDSISYQDVCSKASMPEFERGALSLLFQGPALAKDMAASIRDKESSIRDWGDSSSRITDPDIVPAGFFSECLAPLIVAHAQDLLPDSTAAALVLGPFVDTVAFRAWKKNHGTPDIDVTQQVEMLSTLKKENSASFVDFKAKYLTLGDTDANRKQRDLEAGVLLAMGHMTNEQLQECRAMEIQPVQPQDHQRQAMPASHAQAPEHDWGFVHGSLEHTFALITVKPCNFSAKNWIQELIKGLRENGTMAEVFPGKQAKLLESHFATFLEAIENNRVPRAFVEASNSSGSQVDFSDLRPMLKTAFETLRTKLTEIVPEITMAMNIPQTFQTAEEFLMQQVLDPISHLLALDKEEWSTCTKFSDKVDYDFNTKEFSSLRSDRQPPRAALVFLFTELHLPSKDQVMNRYLGDQAYVDAARKLCDVFGSPADTRVKDLLHPLELEDVIQTMLWVIARNSGKRNADRLGSNDNWNPRKVLTYKVVTIEDEASKQRGKGNGNTHAQRAAQDAPQAKGAAIPPPQPASVPVVPAPNQISWRKITRQDMEFLVPLFEKGFDTLLQDNRARVPSALAGRWEEDLRKQIRLHLIGANFKIRLERGYQYDKNRDTMQNLMPNIKLSEVCHDMYVTFTESQHKDDPTQQLKAFLMQIGVRLFSIYNGVDLPSFLDRDGFKRAFPKARK